MVSESLKEQMNVTTTMVAFGVDELKLAGLTPAPCNLVKPPRVKESPVALECKYWRAPSSCRPEKGNEAKRGSVVFGQVVGVHIDDNIIKDGRIDTWPSSRSRGLGYSEYTTTDMSGACGGQMIRAISSALLFLPRHTGEVPRLTGRRGKASVKRLLISDHGVSKNRL